MRIVFYLLLGIIISGIISAVVIAVVLYYQRNQPIGPTGPFFPPASLFKNTLNFYNGITIDGVPKDIYLINNLGTVTDLNSLTTGWTAVPNAPTGTYYVPSPPGLGLFTKILYGETKSFEVGPEGYASMNFYARINCNDTGPSPTYICERGDIKYIPGLDPVENRVPPWKPDINSKFELTFNCTLTDPSLCHVNPSCITNPSGCMGVTGGTSISFLDFVTIDHPGSRVDSQGLLRTNGGTGTVIPLLPGFYLTGNNQIMDVSFLDGYNSSIDVYALRPINYSQAPGVYCFVNDSNTKLDVSDPTNKGPYLIAHTSQSNLDNPANCPSDELVYPPPRKLLPPSGSTTPIDTFRVNPPGSQPVSDPGGYGNNSQDMGYFSGPSPFNSTYFKVGATLDLKVFRSNQEKNAIPSSLHITSNYLGCAGPCKAMTIAKGTADANIVPETPGYSWNPETTQYLTDPNQAVPTTAPGVHELCCLPEGTTTGLTFIKCNTSKYWQVTGSSNNIANNTGFGYYIFNFAPSPNDMTKTSVNAYLSQDEPGSAFVRAVNMGKLSNDLSVPRAYAWQHDDQFKTVQCVVSDPANISSSHHYNNYKLFVAFGQYRPSS